MRDATGSNTANALLILTFLVPAVLLSAVAGVYVDRIDRRLILIGTNLIRGVLFIGLWAVGDNFWLIILFNTAISIVNVFFSPAEAAMIPEVAAQAADRRRTASSSSRSTPRSRWASPCSDRSSSTSPAPPRP